MFRIFYQVKSKTEDARGAPLGKIVKLLVLGTRSQSERECASDDSLSLHFTFASFHVTMWTSKFVWRISNYFYFLPALGIQLDTVLKVQRSPKKLLRAI